MNSIASNPPRLGDFLATLLARPLRWLVPLVLMVVGSCGYALLSSPKWEAEQTLLVRNEATTSGTQMGRFEGAESMKAAQETLLEIATSRQVVAAALEQLADDAPAYEVPPATPREVDRTIDRISIRAPQGLEFGSSEVVRLRYWDTNRQRALDFNRALGQQLDHAMRELRNRKAESLMSELGKSVELARADLHTVTEQLSALEASMGEDLAELRSLNESSSGTSNLRTLQAHLENELRQALLTQRENQQLLTMLETMQGNPQQLLGTPVALLQAQPNLQRLKSGLTEAQLRTASLNGNMTASHPLVIAALQAEAEVHQRVRDELATSVSSMRLELSMNHSRTENLRTQLQTVRTRMQRIAGMRAEYANLTNEMRDRANILQSAQQQLASARSSGAAAHSASMLTQIDAPATGTYPAGPRKAYIVLAGLVAGLAAGLGVVFLTTQCGAAQYYWMREQQPQAACANEMTAAGPTLQELATTLGPKLLQWPPATDQLRKVLFRTSHIHPSEN